VALTRLQTKMMKSIAKCTSSRKGKCETKPRVLKKIDSALCSASTANRQGTVGFNNTRVDQIGITYALDAVWVSSSQCE
jgi:hypothetical protein